MQTHPYIWTWNTRLPHRRGMLFRVLVRGSMNSCLIEFADGSKTVTSRNALRKARIPTNPRSVRECTCAYQKERTWGYQLFDWRTGRQPWKPLGTFLHARHAARFADHKSLPRILIKCNGCGNEPLRENA